VNLMAGLRLKVLKIEAPTAEIRAITLGAEDGGMLPGYSAGAHIRVTLPEGGERHYSLVNSHPQAGTAAGVETYRLGIRLDEAGKGGSKFMHGLAEGDTLSTSEPRNDFKLVESPAPAILIAGGIGVTPIISMAAELKRQGRPFEFHYTGRSRPLMAFVEEIEEACGDALSIYCDDEAERCIDLKRLIGAAPVDGHIYVCGPRGMIEAVREIAHQHGFHIRTTSISSSSMRPSIRATIPPSRSRSARPARSLPCRPKSRSSRSWKKVASISSMTASAAIAASARRRCWRAFPTTAT
jgi:vanillate O-demethylase ferredoxin subunit